MPAALSRMGCIYRDSVSADAMKGRNMTFNGT